MKILLMLRALILLGIVAPFIPSTNGGSKCYDCSATSDNRNDPCWNKDPPTETIKECEGRCHTQINWEKEQKDGITRDCTDENVHPVGGCETWTITTHCNCHGPLCNNEPGDQIPKERKGNRDADGKLEGGDASTGDPSGDGSGGALSVLVGPSFGVLVMGLLLGVGGALLPLLVQ